VWKRYGSAHGAYGVTFHENSELVDPDPFAVASLALSAISVVLGAVQTYKAVRPSPAPEMKPNHRPIQLEQLVHLESHVERLSAAFRRLGRAVERNASDSDAEFYDAPLRIAATNLMLPVQGLNDLASHYADASLQISGILRWLIAIQTTNPDLAYRIGEHMAEPLSGVAERINEALNRGGPIRLVLVDLRATLDALAQAITSEIDQTRN
jgi:hypothetical protein